MTEQVGGTTTKSCSRLKTCSTRPKIGWNKLEQETTTSQDAVPLVKPYGIRVLIHNGTREQELLLEVFINTYKYTYIRTKCAFAHTYRAYIRKCRSLFQVDLNFMEINYA